MLNGQRPRMGSWTLEHNRYLSLLLDEITGTEDVVKIRQDVCKIHDCVRICGKVNTYYTGSRSEGLDLPGSDADFMYDMNDSYNMEVSQSEADLVQSTRERRFLMINDDIHPGFVFLKCVSHARDQHLLRSLLKMGNNAYLCHRYFFPDHPAISEEFVVLNDFYRRQGPSLEGWTEFEDRTKSGTDHVPSVHCKFWPTSAAEWIDRTRLYGWPAECDKKKIVSFGCHLVPVGYPSSLMKSIEWRVSFSVAERLLVWSFNHAQLQCYAVVKLILKEVYKNQLIRETQGRSLFLFYKNISVLAVRTNGSFVLAIGKYERMPYVLI